MRVDATITPVLHAATGGVARGDESHHEARATPPKDSVSISDEARAANRDSKDRELSDQEEEQVRELSSRDREVRAHEQAHAAAARGLATGGPVYDYQVGPDGKRYAVGGHVNIELREGGTPEETARLAAQAQAAANAPSEPSSQDRAVAARAAAMAAEARSEIKRGEPEGDAGGSPRAVGSLIDRTA